MPKHESFVFEIPSDPKCMELFQKAMDSHYDKVEQYITDEAEKLGIPRGAMYDIWYLRSRSRWTQEKEDYLIQLARENKPLPNVLAGDF